MRVIHPPLSKQPLVLYISQSTYRRVGGARRREYKKKDEDDSPL
jgi:hypothetical protein